MGGYRWSGNTVFTDLTVDGDTVIVDETNNRVGIGTDSPSKTLDVDGEILAKGQLEVNDTTTSSASTGGSLRLSANDGAAMGDSHRLGVVEFTGSEDGSGTQVTGARIEALTDAAWTNVENGCALYFYTTDGDASQTAVLKLDSNKKATLAGDAQIAGDIILDDGGSLKEAGGTAAITFDGSGHVTKIGQDSMSSGDVLTWDGSKFVGEAPTTGDVTGVTAGVGLSGGGSSGALTLTLDLSELSAVTPTATDSFATLDSDGSTEQRTTITALSAFQAGSGLSASSGVLSVDSITSVGTISTGVWQGTAIAQAYVANDSINGDKIADDSINSEHYVDGSIDTAHIADDQVTLAKMAGLARGKFIVGDSSGNPSALAAGANGKILVADANGDPSWTTLSGDATLSAGALTIATGAVEHAMLGGDCVDGDNIADDSINSEHYVDGSIDTAHIADDQVTLAKMAGITRGSIIIGNASGNPALLGIGSNNYVLTSDGTDIAWAEASGGGSTDLNGLSAATVDVAADSLGIIDANDSNASRKESIADLVSAIAGTVISASSGVMSLDVGASATGFVSGGVRSTPDQAGEILAMQVFS